eukprot:TRINITY_DN6758_c0_g1_i2.p1 TRINITY_DN6758_c0_g1~~TRINITY_DN6758_c0_g1_i2.p1  ORF type:complete len:687 (-),score=229.67 TRINITY_DN6758_c0_g1_i2:33-2093(-)
MSEIARYQAVREFIKQVTRSEVDEIPTSANITSFDEQLARLNTLLPNDLKSRSIPETIHYSAIIQLIGTYLQTCLDFSQVNQLSSQIDAMASNQFKHLLRLPDDSVGFFSATPTSARLLGAQSALLKLKAYNARGYKALPEDPIIYVAADRARSAEEICLQLGFPRTSVNRVESSDGSSSVLEREQLKLAICDDINRNKTPFLVIACVDGQAWDDLLEIRELCDTYGIWLHVEGEGTTLLMADNGSPSTRAISAADSVSFDISTRFNLNGYVHWTWMRVPVNIKSQAPPFTSLPFHFQLERAGTQTYTNEITKGTNLISELTEKLKAVDNLEISQLSEMSVNFRFSPNSLENSIENSTLLNNLNEQILLDISEVVPIALASSLKTITENSLNFISFCPFRRIQRKFAEDPSALQLEDAYFQLAANDLTSEMIDMLITALQVETSLIETTLRFREVFKSKVESLEGLENIKVHNFVGLGAIRYVPKFLGDSPTVGINIKQEVDSLNTSLGQQLRDGQKDTRFNIETSEDGNTCITVGVDTEPLTTESVELCVKMIYDAAKEAENKSGLLEKIAEVVRIGIQQAQAELVQQESNQIWEQGIVRNLPVVGSVMNWWSPYQPSPSKGRKFDLRSQSLSPGPQSPAPTTTRSAIKLRPSVSTSDIPKLRSSSSSGDIPSLKLASDDESVKP